MTQGYIQVSVPTCGRPGADGEGGRGGHSDHGDHRLLHRRKKINTFLNPLTSTEVQPDVYREISTPPANTDY